MRGTGFVPPLAAAALSVSVLAQCDPQEVAKLLASDAAAGDYFGYSASISGDTAVVGAPQDDDCGEDSGAAYVFEKAGGAWTQIAKLTASDGLAEDYFGISVAFSSDIIVVGALGADGWIGPDVGAAYVFEKVGGAWVQVARLQQYPYEGLDQFGSSVSVSGDTVLVGARGDDFHGSAYVFEKVGGAWVQNAKLTPSSIQGPLPCFGSSVSISGGTLTVGAPHDQVHGFDSGSAYIFQESGGWWYETARFCGGEWDTVGMSVSVSGNTPVAGALYDVDDHGAAYVFFETPDYIWEVAARLTAADGADGDAFGVSVAIFGDSVVAGAFWDDDRGTDSGSAYVFERVGDDWVQSAKLTASDGAEGDQFGMCVAVNGDAAIVGAYCDDDSGTDSGSVYVFDLNCDCPPDLNGDGLVNSQDFILFLNLFVTGDPAADFNGDGIINSQDFIAFLNAFVAGC